MANIRLIKRRIRVAKNISKITKAMQMVAASKMKKAQEAAISGKPYAQKILELVSSISTKKEIDTGAFPYFKENSSQKILVILISSNKGLCGGLNNNLFRSVLNWFGNSQDVAYLTVGEKGKPFVVRSGKGLVADFSVGPFINSISSLTSFAAEGFIRGEYGKVYLVYNDFESILKHTPTKLELLPITKLPNQENILKSDSLIEPGLKDVLSELLPHYLEVEVRKAILEAEASEHAARMMAMKSATDNAISLTEELVLEYNKIRQQQITFELADITTAREAINE